MCVCVSESSRPRLFNCVSVLLITAWVVVVAAIAHSVPMDVATEGDAVLSLIEATVNSGEG